jgi:DNA-binding transcriptional LysR family regulator
MQLKTLAVFCDVVSWRSFSRAAGENGISQSAASQVVNHLEQDLGVRLIDRSKRPLVLTTEGEHYYAECRKLVERYKALEEEVRSMHDQINGRVRVASIYSVGLHLMSRYVQRFLSQHPKANVRLEYYHPARVYERVEQDKADLGIVSYPKGSRTISFIPWREEPMVLACATTHRLAKCARVSLDELRGENLVGYDPGLRIREEIDRALARRGVDARVVMEFDNIETIKRAVEIDAGVALLPEPTVAREVEAGTLVALPLDTDELVRPVGILQRRGRELTATARRFVELLQAEGNTQSALQPAGANGKKTMLAAAATRRGA